jgi:hypothetical protein
VGPCEVQADEAADGAHGSGEQRHAGRAAQAVLSEARCGTPPDVIPPCLLFGEHLNRQGGAAELPLAPKRKLRLSAWPPASAPELRLTNLPFRSAPELCGLRFTGRPLGDAREPGPGAAQVLLLGIHAVDLARAPAQERHLGTAAVVGVAAVTDGAAVVQSTAHPRKPMDTRRGSPPRHEAPRVRPEAEARRNPTSDRLRADGKRRAVVRPIDRRRPGERL